MGTLRMQDLSTDDRLQVIPVSFGRIHALLVKQVVENFLEIRTACPTRGNRLLPEPGRPFRRVY
jgi:hypothetical protein